MSIDARLFDPNIAIFETERMTGQKTQINLFADENARCNGSSRLGQLNVFYPLMPPSTTFSMFNVISFPERHFAISGATQ